jgi:hypothetical protein
VDLPDFGAIAALQPDIAQFLKATRCWVSGENVWHPGGWLLYAHRVALKHWPKKGEPLLRFEKAHAFLDNLLLPDFSIADVPVWLFRIGDDGIARHIAGLTVRPGFQYVIATREPLPLPHSLMSPSTIQCGGIYALLLTVPNGISSNEMQALASLNLEVSRSIRIWPAGISPLTWDGEGYSEWLSTDSPVFGITHDHPVGTYHLSLDSELELSVHAGQPRNVTFVELGRLSVGRHRIRVKAARPEQRDPQGQVTIDIRDPAPWRPGNTSFSGLYVSVEPPSPSLDMLAEGNLALSVQGPAGRQVGAFITLFGRKGDAILTHEIARFDLPVTTNVWALKLGQFLSHAGQAWKLSEARTGTLTIGNEELGRFIVPLEREARPIQWLCQTTTQETQTRLIDDTGDELAAELYFRSFEYPARRAAIAESNAESGLVVADPGGLFEARRAKACDALIISTAVVRGSLQGLLIEPRHDELAGLSIRDLLDTASTWNTARLAGPLASNRRDRVVCSLLQTLYAKLCGERWVRAEREFLEAPTAPDRLEQLQKQFARQSAGFNAVLRRDFERMAEGAGAGARWFSDAAARYKVSDNEQLSRLALRVASDPLVLAQQADDDLQKMLAELTKHPDLMRGARLVALCALAKQNAGSTKITPDWKW